MTYISKYKTILLINPWEGEIFPPPSIGYLQSAIKYIFKDDAIVFARDLNSAIELLKVQHFDLVAISFHSFSVKYAKLLRELVPITSQLICGGHHPSSLPKQMLDLGYNQVAVGEGENSMIDILLGNTDEIVFNNKMYFPTVDSIPFPDYTGLTGNWKNLHSDMGYPIISSRGCPFSCNFCASSIFWNRKINMRTPQSVISELIYNIEQYGMKNWMFEDDNFTLNVVRSKEICNKIITELNPKYGNRNWQCASRAEVLNDKILCQSLLDAGCTTVWIGVESFSQRSLDKCNKHTTVEKMISGIETAESIGLRTMCQFIIGLPNDTIQDIIETANKIKTTKMSRFACNIAWILPQTSIHDAAVVYGFTDDIYLTSGAPYYTFEQDMNTLLQWQNIINNAKH